MALFDFLKDKKAEQQAHSLPRQNASLLNWHWIPSFRTLLSREKPLMTKAYPSLHNPFGRSD